MFIGKKCVIFLVLLLMPTVSLSCNVPVLPGNAKNILSYGAVAGDGVDDTQSIQDAIDDTPLGGTLYIPAGRFLVNAERWGVNEWGNPAKLYGIYPHSDMTIILHKDAVLEAIPTGADIYSVVSLVNKENITISGGTIKGERNSHLGSTGEHGRVLGIWSSKNIEVVGTRITDAWGDGIYIWDSSSSRSENIRFCKVIVENNRRQGIGIVGAADVLIEESKILGTNGTSPESGINCEPNPDQQVTNVIIRDSEIAGNVGTGVRFDGVDGDTNGNRLEDSIVKNNGYNGVYIDSSSNNILKRNLIENNGTTVSWVAGIVLKNAINALVENNSLRDNVVKDDHPRGVQLNELSSGVIIHDNDICIDEETLRIDDRSSDHAFVETENTYCVRDARFANIKLDFLILLLK